MLRSSSGAHAGATRPAGVFRLLFVVVVTLALAGLAAAVPSPTQANVTYEGVTYNLTRINATKIAWEDSGLYLENFWWGNSTAAQGICDATADALGTQYPGAYYAFARGPSSEWFIWTRFGAGCILFNMTIGAVGNTTVVDWVYGRGAPGASAVITANATNVTAGAAVAVDSAASTCPGGNCTSSWLLCCPNGAISSKTGAAVTFSTGSPGADPDIPVNMTDAPLTCSLQLTIENVNGSDTSSTSITVTLPAAPSAIVDGATFDGILINITAGTPAPLVANRSVCEAGPCTYSWYVDCGPCIEYSSSSTSPVDAPLTGPGNAISVAFDQTTTCNVSLTVTDVYGQTASPSENITLLINPGQGPAPVINDGSGSVNATAGTPLTLSGSGTTCPTGNCTTYWSLACPNSRGSFANRTGASIMVTSGGNASFDINTAGASSAFDCTVDMTVVDANGVAATVSATLSVALAPPDCSRAVFSPAILTSRLNSQVCVAKTEARTGRQPRLATTVTLSLTDAQGAAAAVNVTSILLDKTTAGWQCYCRPSKRDNCSCVPDAALLGGGRFRVMPQWRRNTLPGALADTILQVAFTAATASGSCTGRAVICSSWAVRPGQRPPACRGFNSTGITRDALACA